MTHSTNRSRSLMVREFAAAMMIVVLAATCARAEEVKKTDAAPTGKVEFDCPGLPEASMELNLSRGMFKDLAGIGDAAIVGVFKGLAKATETPPEEITECGHMKAIHELLEMTGGLVQGVHVWVYEDESKFPIKDAVAHYGKKLKSQNWETVLKVRADDEFHMLTVLRSEGAIKGVFLLTHDDSTTVLANILCDISPDRIEKLTAAAAATGIQLDFDETTHKSMLNLFWTSAETTVDPPPAPEGD
jgi:hypothetical protein